MAKQDDYVKTAFRLPQKIHAALLDEAEAKGRSMNAEIIARLEQSFAKEHLPNINILEALRMEAKSKGHSFTINFGDGPPVSSQFEGAYRRGYHQAVAEVASYMEDKIVTNAEQLNFWVEGSGMYWRKDMPLDKMTPPPPFVSISEAKK